MQVILEFWGRLDRSRVGRSIASLVQSTVLLIVLLALSQLTDFIISLTVQDDLMESIADQTADLLILFAQISAVASGSFIVIAESIYGIVEYLELRNKSRREG